MEEGNRSDRLLHALCYPIGLVGIFLLLTQKDEDSRFHALNGIFLWVALIAIQIVFGIVTSVPGLGVMISMLMSLVSLVVFIYAIMLAVKVYNTGEKPEIPVITDFVKKFVNQV